MFLLRLRVLGFAIVNAFRFIKRKRQRDREAEDRLRSERREEREHQFKMLSTIFEKMVEASKTNSDALVAIADAQRAQSEIMATWLKGFQTPTTGIDGPHALTDEDEWMEEQRRLFIAGDPNAIPPDLPAEFQLAYKLEHLNQDSLGDFDREGSDFK